MPTIHEPVLLREILDQLNPQPGQNFIDGTFGGGGHGLAILERIRPKGKLAGIDWDRNAVQAASGQDLILINDNYRNLKAIYERLKRTHGLGEISGILLDLGLSSDQLSDDDRGFSFTSVDSLDMRFDTASAGPTAADIVNTASERELARILTDCGEEPLAGLIAKAIIKERQKGEGIRSAAKLVQLISDLYRRKFRQPSRRNPATRTLQALRIFVNDEFGNIRTALPQALELLRPGGRLAVISFHSGEDRLVKNFFRDLAKTDEPKIKLITKKPIIAAPDEVQANPRARSAKLRVVEKI